MKTAFILLTLCLSLSALNASADCSLTLKSKKTDSAGAKLGDVNFSKKQIEALRSVCKIQRETFSTDELVKLEEQAFQKRIAKLKGKKS